MLIGELVREDLARSLRSEGIHLVTGAFTTHLSITVPHLVDEFADMYARYPFEAPPGVDDARLRIAERRPLRRGLRPHVRTWVNGEPLVGWVPSHRAFTALETSLNWSIVVGGSAPLILHAAVMERDGRALIMPAPSGSGKSTLCAALVLRGWRLFSDEATVFGFSDGLLYPNPRPVSLKNTSIDVIRAFQPGVRLSPVYHGTPKGDVAYMHAPEESIARAGEPAVPGLVVTPAYIAGRARHLLARHRGVLARLHRGSARPPGTALWMSEKGFADEPKCALRLHHDLHPRRLGHPVNPHLFRDCAATNIAIDDPDHIGIVWCLLGHRTPATTEKYYNLAGAVEASRRFQNALLARRHGDDPRNCGTRNQ